MGPDGLWSGVERTEYKNEPGTWMDVSREILFESPDSRFQVRRFVLQPGGYTSYEKHQHEHSVLVLGGHGRVRLGEEWHAIGPMDIVHVTPGLPHQFVADTEAELAILCTVDAERDRPILLGNEAPSGASIEANR